MKLIYPAIFTPLSNNPSGYCVEVPDLPGCVTQGDNIEMAIEMAEDAASGWILTSIEDGEEIPKPSNLGSVVCEAGSFVNYLSLDMEEYAKKCSVKSVKKTLTIPQWLNTAAEKDGINFSQVLQSALKKQLNLFP